MDPFKFENRRFSAFAVLCESLYWLNSIDSLAAGEISMYTVISTVSTGIYIYTSIHAQYWAPWF